MLHIGTPIEMLIVAIAAILAAALASFASSLAMGTDLMLGTLYYGVAILFLSIPVHLFFLARAPAEIDAQTNSELLELQDRIENHDQDEQLIDEFGAVLREARPLVGDYMGGDEEDAATEKARRLNAKIESLAVRCDAKTRAIIIGDDRKAFDRRRWDNILFDDMEWSELAQLGLRIQAIERAIGI